MMRAAVSTALIVFGCAPAAALAGAGDDARVLTDTISNVSNTGPNNVATRTLGCDFGERAIAGGIRSQPFNTSTPTSYSSPFASSQAGAPFTGLVPNQWRGRARNLSTQTRNFVVFAVCSASSDATLLSIDTSATPSDEGGGQFEAIATPLCPSGQRAIGGGGFVDEFGAPATNLQQSGPVDETGQPSNTVDGDIPRGWLSSVLTTANGASFRAYAICSATSTATVQVDSKEIAAATPESGAGICPTGTRALSGGVTTAGNPSSAINASVPGAPTGGAPLGAGPPTVAQTWFTNVSNVATTRTYNFSAVCEGPSPTPADPTDPTDPNNPTPSNAFTLGRLDRNRDRGTAVLPVNVPGAGEVTLASTKLKSQTVSASGAGAVPVAVKAAAGNSKRKLRRTGKLKASLEITFAPTGGTATAQSLKVKLVRD